MNPEINSTLRLNQDSKQLFKFEKVDKNLKVSDKFNKLLGAAISDASPDNLKLIQGNSPQFVSNVNFKSSSIYDTSLTQDFIINKNKFQPYSGNVFGSGL